MIKHESIQRAAARLDPARREEENVQRRIRREQHGVLEHEARQRRMANANKHVHMATKFVNDEYMFHQECGSWDQECVHGCGYMHLSSSTAGTRKKCCTNGRLSSVSANFDGQLTDEHQLKPFPLFMRNITISLVHAKYHIVMYQYLPEVVHIQQFSCDGRYGGLQL